MDLKLLENFCVIAEEASFSRAAARLRLTQPALSLQMKKLEDEFGAVLLDRLSTGICLTAAGEKLLQNAPRLMSSLSDLRHEVADADGEANRQLVVGVIPTVAPYLLPRVIASVREQAPGIRLTLRENVTDILLGELKSGALDVAVMSTCEDTTTLHTEIVGDDPLHLIVPAEHPLAQRSEAVSLSSIGGEPFLALHEVHCLARQTSDLCRSAANPPSIVLRTSQLETVRALVGAGLGISIVPAMMCTPLDESHAYTCLPIAEKPSRPIVVGWSILRYRCSASRVFLQAVRQALSDLDQNCKRIEHARRGKSTRRIRV